MPNRLADETSPYLQQHKDNPVNWFPWNQTALKIAQQENKPIFLSIGYSACHWCHVMAHESFENPETAQLLNDNFINIKVDREERPDIDDIYMQAVVLLTGQGGWPLSVFLTPDLEPFYGGTYFPPAPRYGMPSFNQVLTGVIETWKNQPQSVQKNAEILTSAIESNQSHQGETSSSLNLDAIVARLHAAYDWQSGGWGQAPRFPQPMLIDFLIQRGLAGNAQASEIVTHLLDHMAQGGMYDLVGGGFHRYSTDAIWLIPHFEKMLYDNAQLARTYLHAYSLTGKPLYKNVAQATLAFLQREMTNPEGGFFASMDADTSEGEGRYYAWNINDLQDVLTHEEYLLLQEMTEINQHGNFEKELNVIRLRNDKNADLHNLQPIFNKLKAARDLRTPPGKDQKIITEWNAMTIQAFAETGLLLNQPEYLQIAQDAAKFILGNLISSEGKLFRSWRAGKANQPGTLGDYAVLIAALQAVYSIEFDSHIYQQMCLLFTTLQKDFASDDHLYYDTSVHVSDLIIRPRNIQDNATPSGNAMAAYAHWLFANYNHDPDLLDSATRMIHQAGKVLEEYPTSFGYWLQVAGLLGSDARQIALVSPSGLESLQPFLAIYRRTYRPFDVIAASMASMDAESLHPRLLDERPSLTGNPTAYVCQGFVCQQPVTNLEEFEDQIR